MKNNISTSVLVLAVVALCCNSLQVSAQGKASPAATATGTVNGAKITIAYAQPSVKGRKIFGGLVPNGEVWRAGANEATTIEFSKDVKIDGKALPAGKYSFFAIPNENEWVLIFNKDAKQWGAFKYQAKDDALRVNVKPKKAPAMTEALLYTIDKNGVNLLWDNTEVSFSVK